MNRPVDSSLPATQRMAGLLADEYAHVVCERLAEGDVKNALRLAAWQQVMQRIADGQEAGDLPEAWPAPRRTL